VGALVDHLIDEQRWVAPLMAGRSLAEAGDLVERMGSPAADRPAAWEKASFAAAEAVSAPGALDRTVELSRGATPAPDYLAEMVLDLCVHAWDLGKAVGSERPLPAELVEAVDGEVRKYGDLTSFGTMFKAAIEVPDDAPAIDRLVAYTGRRPDWPA
jgi:uncharacterized protein (TIGR03086 family)